MEIILKKENTDMNQYRVTAIGNQYMYQEELLFQDNIVKCRIPKNSLKTRITIWITVSEKSSDVFIHKTYLSPKSDTPFIEAEDLDLDNTVLQQAVERLFFTEGK